MDSCVLTLWIEIDIGESIPGLDADSVHHTNTLPARCAGVVRGEYLHDAGPHHPRDRRGEAFVDPAEMADQDLRHGRRYLVHDAGRR